MTTASPLEATLTGMVPAGVGGTVCGIAFMPLRITGLFPGPVDDWFICL